MPCEEWACRGYSSDSFESVWLWCSTGHRERGLCDGRFCDAKRAFANGASRCVHRRSSYKPRQDLFAEVRILPRHYTSDRAAVLPLLWTPHAVLCAVPRPTVLVCMLCCFECPCGMLCMGDELSYKYTRTMRNRQPKYALSNVRYPYQPTSLPMKAPRCASIVD